MGSKKGHQKAKKNANFTKNPIKTRVTERFS